MKIALIGYGKMGQEIEQIAIASGHEIVLKIDINNQHEFTAENLKKAEVAIEFTTPHTAIANFYKCFSAGIPTVAGSTGWMDKFNDVKLECEKLNGKFFYASNYSLGVNIFSRVNKFLAKLMNNFPDYEANMLEVHHTQKLDAPSGTAITLAEGVIDNIDRLNKWELSSSENNEALRIDYIRQFKVPGIHTIHYESDVDLIEITHSAKNRKGLALGAIKAAEFLITQKQGIYTMDDLLKF